MPNGVHNFVKIGFKVCQKQNKLSKNGRTFFTILRKYQNFAKFGHTAPHTLKAARTVSPVMRKLTAKGTCVTLPGQCANSETFKF